MLNRDCASCNGRGKWYGSEIEPTEVCEFCNGVGRVGFRKLLTNWRIRQGVYFSIKWSQPWAISVGWFGKEFEFGPYWKE